MTPRDGAFDQALAQLIEGRLSDPFAFLGMHETPAGTVIRTFQPGALAVEVLSRETGAVIGTLSDTADGLFVGGVDPATPYTLRVQWPGAVQETEDPYSFGVVLGDTDLYLHAEGKHWELADRMGAQPREMDGVAGVAFSVWAPNARRVSVIGDFNAWDGRRHPMRLRHDAGIWELFIPRVNEGTLYKYEVLGADGQVRLKADPLARATERPPATGSVVAPLPRFEWGDGEWMAERVRGHAADAPIAVYEVHAASWLRPAGDPTGTLDWKSLADKLIPYATQMGFTHIELLPIMEHPFAGSWGYQPVSQFAPSARFGPAEDFAFFVNECHRAGLGVILDWVPAHFPNDEHGLVHFDGTSLYEHQDPREGFHKDWNTLIYNFGRAEVRGFLIASGLWWLETFHIDGLRVDAVASMLYRDYSRQPGEWIPNIYGGRENLEAVEFLKQFNTIVAERCPGAMTIAEESTAWPGVSARVTEGGLGFTYKWNMGWMHDTLSYMEHQPVHRPWHHNEMTFGLIYAFSERFVLPLSHDEVVHGKGSLIGKMPGDQWQRFANLRAYFGFMWTHPGKKLLFMGGEIAQEREWSHDGEIDWGLLEQPEHAAIQRLITDLNNIYAAEGALHTRDADPQGFSWVVGDDTANSVFAYLRHGRQGAPLLVAINMTPVPRHGYRIGVPVGGGWRELLNTDAVSYGGGGIGNDGAIYAGSTPSHGHAQSLELSLPPLATVILKPEGPSDVVA